TVAGGRLLFALPADGAVQAETSLRSFIQTLSQTFAHLKVGLAIFDRRRQLVLFNPALSELTGLEPEFLSSRPTLFSVLDAMRERRMIPEPRDYKLWRREMMELEAAAATGQYLDLWSLPGGQTYRVTGQPHPDGAVAFIIEDISEEMSVTRTLRAET
ncbi:diguanylate cyclase, partial [Thioclava sp. BHET1]